MYFLENKHYNFKWHKIISITVISREDFLNYLKSRYLFLNVDLWQRKAALPAAAASHFKCWTDPPSSFLVPQGQSSWRYWYEQLREDFDVLSELLADPLTITIYKWPWMCIFEKLSSQKRWLAYEFKCNQGTKDSRTNKNNPH